MNPLAIERASLVTLHLQSARPSSIPTALGLSDRIPLLEFKVEFVEPGGEVISPPRGQDS